MYQVFMRELPLGAKIQRLFFCRFRLKVPEVISGFAALVECQSRINKRCMNYGVPQIVAIFY